MTIAGKGSAKSAMTSIRPLGATASISRCAIARTCDAIASTRRGVNALEQSLRSLVWAGASRNSICRAITSATGSSDGRPSAAIRAGSGVRFAEKRWSTVSTSS